jgi:hypothetical protein
MRTAPRLAKRYGVAGTWGWGGADSQSLFRISRLAYEASFLLSHTVVRNDFEHP